jgi:DNA invertase Pin-like site-specific DNA recombinase
MNAFSYLRVSSKGQIDGDGFPRQREVIGRYAKQNGLEIVTEFIESISGTTESINRPALTDLMLALKFTDGPRVVLVEHAHRLARDLMVSEILLAEFKKSGVKVIGCDSGTDLTVEDGDPTKKLIRQILGAVSEWDKNVMVLKLRAARIRCGKKEGRKPYGTKPGEAEVLKKMIYDRDHGTSLEAITTSLNILKIKPRQGTRWHKTAVCRILARQEAT